MADRPRRSAANKQLATPTITSKRRTSKQKAEDDAATAKNLEDSKQQLQLELQKKIAEVAELEQRMRNEDSNYQQHNSAPEPASTHSTQTAPSQRGERIAKPVSALDKSVQDEEDSDDVDVQMDVEATEKPAVANDQDMQEENGSEGDADDVEYDPGADVSEQEEMDNDDGDAEDKEPKKKGKANKPKPSTVFRTNVIATNVAKAGQKRKSISEDVSSSSSPISTSKRTKGQFASNLTSDWRQKTGAIVKPGGGACRLKSKDQTVVPDASPEAVDGEDEDGGGMFAEDEPVELLVRARESKSIKAPSNNTSPSVPLIARRRTTTQNNVSVTVVKKDIDEATDAAIKKASEKAKRNMKKGDLPFPESVIEGSWKKRTLPAMAAWAATLTTPTLCNSDAGFTDALQKCLKATIPGEDGSSADHAAVRKMASEYLNTWRSQCRKVAVKVVKDKMTASERKDNTVSCATLAESLVPETDSDGNVVDYPMLYKDTQERNGLWLNVDLLEVYAYHWKLVRAVELDFGKPTGALGMCAAILEGVYRRWLTGVDISATSDKGDPDLQEYKKFQDEYHTAVENYVSSALLIKSKKWGAINSALGSTAGSARDGSKDTDKRSIKVSTSTRPRIADSSDDDEEDNGVDGGDNDEAN